MGPYCVYCERRCFVRDPNRPGWLLATCADGKRRDVERVGYDADVVRDQIDPGDFNQPLTPMGGQAVIVP